MATYYVGTPFSNAIGLARDCYNNNCASGSPCMYYPENYCTSCGSSDTTNCQHIAAIDNTCCPGDIQGPANASVWCVVSLNILSIKTIKTGPTSSDPQNNGDLLCGTTPPAGFAWVNEGVKVELYTQYGAQGTKVGTVFFGHLRNRIANGVYNDPGIYTKRMGYLGHIDCCTCPSSQCGPPVPGNCKCNCYKGIHVHMARSSTWGSTFEWQYGASLPAGQWVYKWVV